MLIYQHQVGMCHEAKYASSVHCVYYTGWAKKTASFLQAHPSASDPFSTLALCKIYMYLLLIICSVALQTVCSSASSRCRTRLRDSSPALVDVTISLLCLGNFTGFQCDNESTSSWPSWSTRRSTIQLQTISSMTVSLSLTTAVAGYTVSRHRHV